MDVPSKKDMLKADDCNDAKPILTPKHIWKDEAAKLLEMAKSEEEAGRPVFARWFAEKAQEYMRKMEHDDLEMSDDLLNATDHKSPSWGKDELEQDLARGMHELEETYGGPRHSPFDYGAWTTRIGIRSTSGKTKIWAEE